MTSDGSQPRGGWNAVLGPVLLAGDVQDVSEMRRIAREMPATTPVTMFIEVFCPMQTFHVQVPGHVSVTWLVRGRAMFDSSPCAVRSRGERLAVAVHAWCAEWACAVDSENPTSVTVWLGARTAPSTVRMVRAILEPRCVRHGEARSVDSPAATGSTLSDAAGSRPAAPTDRPPRAER